MYLKNDLIKWVYWLNDFCELRVMDIHWNYQNLLFSVSIVWHRLSANQIIRYFKPKNLKTIWGIKLIFYFHWNYKNILFWVILQNTLERSVCRIFYFYFDLLILIPGIHCYIVFVVSGICELVLKLTMVTPRRVIPLDSCIN